jgi:hypothetical protein
MPSYSRGATAINGADSYTSCGRWVLRIERNSTRKSNPASGLISDYYNPAIERNQLYASKVF